jgi:Ca2+-binding EF-hand superfamily protein
MNPIALLLVLVSLPTEASSSDTLFAKLDRNQDHKVTTDEITHSQRSFFKRALRVADRNEDGALSREELTVALTDPKPVQLPGTNAGTRPSGMDFRQLDRNGDGKIDKDELPPRMKQFAKQMDSNDDGQIDAAEFAAAVKRRDARK